VEGSDANTLPKMAQKRKSVKKLGESTKAKPKWGKLPKRGENDGVLRTMNPVIPSQVQENDMNYFLFSTIIKKYNKSV